MELDPPAGSVPDAKAGFPAEARCPSCGRAIGGEDRFCTACGSPIQAANGSLSPARRLSFALPGRINRTVAFVAIIAVGLAIFAGLETWHAQQLSGQLATTRRTLHETQEHLARTIRALSSANALSQKRRTVLLQAQTVLDKVNPLLSSVDGLKSNSDSLQSDASSLQSDSESFINDVTSLVNYLISTDSAYWDISYISSSIDSANADLDSISADESLIAGDNSAYGRASTGFGDKADAFSKAVLALEKQLHAAVSK